MKWLLRSGGLSVASLDSDEILLSIRPRSSEACGEMFAFLQKHAKPWSVLSSTGDSDFRGLATSVYRPSTGKTLKLELRYGMDCSDREVFYWRTLAHWATLKVGQVYKVKVRDQVLEAPAISFEGERWPVFEEGTWTLDKSPDDLGVGLLVTNLGLSSRVEQLTRQVGYHMSSLEGALLDRQKAEIERQVELESQVEQEMSLLDMAWKGRP